MHSDLPAREEEDLRQIKGTSVRIEPALWPECCIYKVPASLLRVKEEAYTPLLISIGPIHYNNKKLEEMQKQKERYLHFFWERLVNKRDLVHYKAFLEKEEHSIRHCYQQKFPDINKDQFITMILLDAVFIMELFLREAKRWEHKDDHILTQPCLRKGIQRDLLLLENQLPMHVLVKLYDTVVLPSNLKEHNGFLKLAYEYFASCYPQGNFEQKKWEKSLHFTDLVRRPYLPMKLTYDNDNNQSPQTYEKECMLRTATKLNEAGISFEMVRNSCLLDIEFERNPFFSWFLCLGCLPCSKCVKSRFQFPQLKVDHTTECILRNLIAFELCHYPEEPYICNYVSLIDSLIHTKDDVELLVEKEAIVHDLGSDKELATLVNGLCKHVVTNSTCYRQIIGDLNNHYNSKWKWAMGTLRWVYFRDPWRSSSTIVGIVFLIVTIFNLYRGIRATF